MLTNMAASSIRLIAIRHKRMETVNRKTSSRLSALPAQLIREYASSNRGGATTTSGSDQSGELSCIQQLFKGGARVTKAAHILWAQFVKPSDFVVDATCGNGADTLWLARAVGPSGNILALDIQEEAIQATRSLLEWELPQKSWPDISLQKVCHSTLKALLQGRSPQLVCFNLGYLPFGDKERMTKPATTIAAIQASLEAISKGGILSVISYVGHAGGLEEHNAVMEALSAQPPNEWTVCSHRIINRPTAPVLTLCVRSC